jgi:hypothetical protein
MMQVILRKQNILKDGNPYTSIDSKDDVVGNNYLHNLKSGI